jgi:hypothetical protein
MFPVNLSEKLKRLTFKISVVFLATLFAVVLGPNLLELEGSQALAKKKKKIGVCYQTANVVYDACVNELKDDYNIAVANCINLEDFAERKGCLKEARDDSKDAREECKDQYWARREVCEDIGGGPYDPEIDPADFVDPATITSANANPYFPLVPGYRWKYETYEEGDRDNPIETTVVEVTDETIMIEGVLCVVVHDIVYEGDSTEDEDIIEATDDWYGQQTDGTVWYFGEWSLSQIDCDPEVLCEGLLSEEGSWKSGWDGAKAGIIMFAHPSMMVGTVYRQEVSWGNAEDVAEVISFGEEPVTAGGVVYGRTTVLQNREFSPLEPDVEEFKYYAPGVGVVLEENEEDGTRVELIEFEN